VVSLGSAAMLRPLPRRYPIDNPAECSGPPHLLGPVGFGRSWGGKSGLLMTPLPTGHLS